MSRPQLRGGAPVGQLAHYPVIEAVSVIYFRHWCESAGQENMLLTEFESGLGARRGRRACKQFQSLCDMCLRHARRPFVRHSVGCKCVGADEACFANLVAAAAEADTEDAMMIATLMVKAQVAPLVTGLAVDVGLALKQMQLAIPQELNVSSQLQPAPVFH